MEEVPSSGDRTRCQEFSKRAGEEEARAPAVRLGGAQRACCEGGFCSQMCPSASCLRTRTHPLRRCCCGGGNDAPWPLLPSLVLPAAEEWAASVINGVVVEAPSSTSCTANCLQHGSEERNATQARRECRHQEKEGGD